MTDIVYLLECAWLMAKRRGETELMYFTGMAILAAGGEPEPSDNHDKPN